MSLVGDIISSVASGGITAIAGGVTGVAGAAVSKYFEYKSAGQKLQSDAQNNAHELAMKQADLEITKAEATSNFKITEASAAANLSIAETQAFQVALNSDTERFANSANFTPAQNWLGLVVDAIRGLVRPGLTVYLAVIVSLVYWQNMKVMTHEGMTIDPEKAFALVSQSQNTLVYLFTTCVLFWFGSRYNVKDPSK